jgi:colanic acid/amylovoran biosynthesis glycosyltransferase
LKILVCANSFGTRVVGPSVFNQHLFKINADYKDHDVRFLTEDTNVETDKIYAFKARYPRRLVALDFIFRQVDFYRHAKRIHKEFPFDILVFSNLKYGLLSRLLLPKSVKMIGFITEYMTINACLRYHETYRRLFLFRFSRFFEYLAALKIERISVCSNDLKHRIEAGYGIKSDRISVLYHGFDVDLIEYKSPLNPLNLPIKLLFVKSNLRSGGIDILAKALAQLPEYTFELSVIGPLDSKKAEIDALIKDLPHVNLRFLGIKSQSEVYQEMQENDILCTPSRVESLGIANAEGLASGISVVSTREGGIIEVLENGKNGWLAEPENADDLAKTLKNCIEADPSVRAEKSHLGRLFVEQNFDYRRLNQSFLETCTELLNN